MSVDYNKYLDQHTSNVFKGYEWIKRNLPDILNDVDCEYQIQFWHDYSKYSSEEYEAYDKYFYGEKTAEVKKNFDYAWLHHIHNNPHHWQHWILINDDPGEGMVILDMPHHYIIEMICDWMSFSFKNDTPTNELFDWYDSHKAYMKLSDKTRETVEDILEKLKAKLDELSAEE